MAFFILKQLQLDGTSSFYYSTKVVELLTVVVYFFKKEDLTLGLFSRFSPPLEDCRQHSQNHLVPNSSDQVVTKPWNFVCISNAPSDFVERFEMLHISSAFYKFCSTPRLFLVTSDELSTLFRNIVQLCQNHALYCNIFQDTCMFGNWWDPFQPTGKINICLGGCCIISSPQLLEI